MADIIKKGMGVAEQLKDNGGELASKAGSAVVGIKDIKPEDVLIFAMKVPGSKIDREAFLRKELGKYYSKDKVQIAIDFNPAYAGIPKWSVNKISKEVIAYETNKVSAASFLAGIPGGVAAVGTISADVAHYFSSMLRVMQKLAYLYGFEEFEFDEDQVSDRTMNQMLVFSGVMLGVDAAKGGVTLIANAAANKVRNKLAQKALTKGTIYPIVKKVSQALGVKMTKDIFAKGVSKTVPVAGGAISGGLSYASFKTCCNRLQRDLSSTNLCDPAFYHNSNNTKSE